MPKRLDYDSSSWTKLLQLFCRLLVDGKRHYQSDLAKELKCSPQAIIRMTDTIEGVLKFNFESGTENRRKWYRVSSKSNHNFGLGFEELRYLNICREMASGVLPSDILSRMDDTIFDVSVGMLNASYGSKDQYGKRHFSLFSKGRIDYSPHAVTIDSLMAAIEKHWICQLEYKTGTARASVPHRFAPARMISMNQALYVLGATVEPDGETVRHCITLAVHRITSISITGKHYTIDFPNIDDSAFGLPWHEPRQYHIHVKASAANYVRERIWSEDQEIKEQADGSILLTLTGQSERELVSWVNSFGGEAKIVAADKCN